jgi:hypothetical protein
MHRYPLATPKYPGCGPLSLQSSMAVQSSMAETMRSKASAAPKSLMSPRIPTMAIVETNEDGSDGDQDEKDSLQGTLAGLRKCYSPKALWKISTIPFSR